MPDITVTIPDASLEDVRVWMAGQWAPHATPLLAAGAGLSDYAPADQVSLILAGLVALASRSQQREAIAAAVAKQAASVADLTAVELGVAVLVPIIKDVPIGIPIIGPGGRA